MVNHINGFLILNQSCIPGLNPSEPRDILSICCCHAIVVSFYYNFTSVFISEISLSSLFMLSSLNFIISILVGFKKNQIPFWTA